MFLQLKEKEQVTKTAKLFCYFALQTAPLIMVGLFVQPCIGQTNNTHTTMHQTDF